MLESIPLVRLVCELDTVVGQAGVKLIRNGGYQMPQELGGDRACHLWSTLA